MDFSETYVIRSDDGEIRDYVFVDPSRMHYYPVPKRHAFKHSVSFYVGSGLTYNYPVVFDDHVTSSGEKLETASYGDVPPYIKRRLGAWLKVQGVPCSGPAPMRTTRSAKKTVGTGSDRIKEQIVRLHPGTASAEWKRRTRNATTDGIVRRFEHSDGRSVDTLERSDGSIVINVQDE